MQSAPAGQGSKVLCLLKSWPISNKAVLSALYCSGSKAFTLCLLWVFDPYSQLGLQINMDSSPVQQHCTMSSFVALHHKACTSPLQAPGHVQATACRTVPCLLWLLQYQQCQQQAGKATKKVQCTLHILISIKPRVSLSVGSPQCCIGRVLLYETA